MFQFNNKAEKIYPTIGYNKTNDACTNYYDCPRYKKQIPDHKCSVCEHCALITCEYVKCTYFKDLENNEKKYSHTLDGMS